MRMRYYHEKKVPQLRWMLHQARALLGGRQTAAVPSSDAEPLVIDLGCGKGDFALLLAAAMPQLCVLGIDANADAVTYASERALAAGLTNTCFRVADAASLEAAPPAASAAPPAASAAPPAASAAAALPSEHDGGAVASLREWHAAQAPSWSSRCTRAAASRTSRSASPPSAAPRAWSAPAASASTAAFARRGSGACRARRRRRTSSAGWRTAWRTRSPTRRGA
ncbi:hypothetical protein EMIHUDRAFT_442881 [Emiliania huxleyi CCMP1516]|uniref:Methyltransferase domain-containing protein n=2 Tax=Emiliania huxleyi TaxID=2903 RepID=A0A0D3JZH3_EMIH1|nr:hypothetical protein EMIHUDRAFT_442881 [Emiliania huxleyi CCMP1516]EOD28908.1 hypothetical protein EMIHUDRAFT_442881 [Emiliania huxleyi CCMP1516]|eukprot:XP_005781337.1 hypothetical protein EMIHUDRAFT_442881 [Emiliania huxleyi CCMP1516]